MKLTLVLVLLDALVFSEGVLPVLNNIHTHFEYKYSFRGPHLLDSKGNVPFWNHGGSAIPSDDYLRVCPSVRSHRGWAWSRESLTANHWVVDVSMRIAGRLKTGADGMAIWVTSEPGQEGPVYGSSDRWKGVGLFLDSFDNDAKGDNPKIQLVLNDGSVSYDHRSDGALQQSGSCLKDFRNKPYPVKVRMTYLQGVLEVWVHDGVSVMENDYELCVRVENDQKLKFIPAVVYMGVSAATGGLSDDHDVDSFLTYSALTNEERAIKKMLENDTAFNELTNKYSQLSGEFDQRRNAYINEHPDVPAAAASSQYHNVDGGRGMPGEGMDWQRRMELEQSMQVVADMQRALHREIQSLGKKVEVLLSAERRPAGAGGEGVLPSSVQADLAQIRASEHSILSQLSDLRAVVDRVASSGGGGGIASEQLQPFYEVKGIVTQQSDQLTAINEQLQELGKKRCPSSNTTCLRPWLFIMMILIQTAIYIGYGMYSQAQERKAKKFF